MRALAAVFAVLAPLVAAPALAADAGAALSVDQAIQLALQNNLTTRLAKAQTDAARARVLEAAGALLPNALGYVSQQRVLKTNLAAQGFPPGGLFNPLLGPYDSFDARVLLSERIFDLESIQRARAAKAGSRLAVLRERLAAEQVSAAAALAYLGALRAHRGVETAQADLALAQRLQALAEDQKRAGSATGLDVARARTRAAQQQLRLLQAQVAERDVELRLKRVTGLPLGRPVALSDSLKPARLQLPAGDAAVSDALGRRAEAAAAREAADQARLLASAAGAARLPSLTLNGDAGVLGNTPESNSHVTGGFGGRVSLPLFAGGQLAARQRQAKAVSTEEEARLADELSQIEEDVRSSLQQADAAQQQQTVASQALGLARQELSLAQDRFAAGVGSNVELTEAQDGLARAESDETAALVDANAARVNLAMSLGAMTDFKY